MTFDVVSHRMLLVILIMSITLLLSSPITVLHQALLIMATQTKKWRNQTVKPIPWLCNTKHYGNTSIATKQLYDKIGYSLQANCSVVHCNIEKRAAAVGRTRCAYCPTK